jgi:hypothetical protein
LPYDRLKGQAVNSDTHRCWVRPFYWRILEAKLLFL